MADERKTQEPSSFNTRSSSSRTRLMLAVLSAAFVWSYWPTLTELVATWDREPDYSHGFLVPPLCILFLWLRRREIPQSYQPSHFGLVFLVVSVGVRYLGVRFSIASCDGYSILIWLAGIVMLVGGWPLLRWSLPAIGFLFFMVPLPFRVERILSIPLQLAATRISCFALQCLGQPAFSEGTTILLGIQQLEVEQACSGLRIFFGTFALAFAYIIAMRREFWESIILIVGVVPIALFSNSLRIVVTGLLYQYYSDEAARKFSHDIAGFLMIPIAAACFGILVWFLSRLVRETESLNMSDFVEMNRLQA